MFFPQFRSTSNQTEFKHKTGEPYSPIFMKITSKIYFEIELRLPFQFHYGILKPVYVNKSNTSGLHIKSFI